MDEFTTNGPAEQMEPVVPAACFDQPQAECGSCGGCGGCCGATAAEAQAEISAIQTPQLPEQPAGEPPVTVVDIHFRSGGKTYFFDPGALKLSAGDHVIIDTARGQEYGFCSSGNHKIPARDVVAPLRRVLRIATDEDERIAAANREKEKKAFAICQQKIAEHKLEMQLVSAEYAFDGSKILFFFTADNRVDFRDLVKSLASVFRTRIELRQIGVRDKAKMVGGLGICGRPFCCSEFLDDFQPVSIKMAKVQNLSLNPTKISGTCGRLMCCLKYEQEGYEDLLRVCPKAESFVDTPDGRGSVCDVDLLRQSVKVRMEDHPETIGVYKNDEIYVIRNGKAKKNDPPIPKDFAPISGGGVRRKPKEEEAPFPVLEDVIIKSEPYDLPQSAEAPAKPASGSNNRRRRRGSQEKQSREPAPKAPVAEQAAGEHSGSRRPRRRRSKPNAEGNKPAPVSQAQGSAPASGDGSSNNRPRRRRRPRNGPKPPETN